MNIKIMNKSCNKQERIKNGFTLIEIVIAVAILVIVAVPIARALMQSAKNNQLSKNTIEATQIMQAQMEDIKNRLGSEDLSQNGPGIATGSVSWDYPLAKFDDDSDAGASASFTSSDIFKKVTVGSNEIGKWKCFDKSKNYIIEYTVEKGDSTTEAKADVASYKNKICETSPYEISTSNTKLSGADYYMNLSIKPSGAGVEFENLTPGIGGSASIGSLGSVEGNPATDSDALTFYIKYGLGSDKTTVKVFNSYMDSLKINFLVSGDNDGKLSFETATGSMYLNQTIDRQDIMDASGLATASTTNKVSAVYTIKIKVCKKDNINWDNPLANAESKRVIRK